MTQPTTLNQAKKTVYGNTFAARNIPEKKTGKHLVTSQSQEDSLPKPILFQTPAPFPIPHPRARRLGLIL